MLKEAKINNKKILDLANSIPNIAEKEGWVLTLDREECALFYSSKVIPDNSELFQLTDEYSVYLDEKLNPKGLMIEYYGVNFVKHHPEFEEISKEVFGRDKTKIKTVDPRDKRKKEAVVLRALLEKTLIIGALKQSAITR